MSAGATRREASGQRIARLILREKDVERQGDSLMAQYGFTVWRFSQARATRQSPGIPDRKYTHRARGLACWWEAKAPGGKQRAAQREFQLDVESCGEHYVLGDVEALAEWLRTQVRPTNASANATP